MQGVIRFIILITFTSMILFICEGKGNLQHQSELRCHLICQSTEQCDHCRSRLPVRFGKRNKIQLLLEASAPYNQQVLPYPCNHLLTLLLQRATHTSINNDDIAAPAALQFQLQYE